MEQGNAKGAYNRINGNPSVSIYHSSRNISNNTLTRKLSYHTDQMFYIMDDVYVYFERLHRQYEVACFNKKYKAQN
jgi:hypothetical protein